MHTDPWEISVLSPWEKNHSTETLRPFPFRSHKLSCRGSICFLAFLKIQNIWAG